MVNDPSLGFDERFEPKNLVFVEDGGVDKQKLWDLRYLRWRSLPGQSVWQTVKLLSAELNVYVITTVVESRAMIKEALQHTTKCSELRTSLDTKPALIDHASSSAEGLKKQLKVLKGTIVEL